MQVAIDATPLETGHKKRGIGVYTKHLVDALRRVDKANEYILFTRGQKLPKVDLVHYPYFDLFFLTLPVKKKYKTVITIHDLIPLVFPQFYPKGARGTIKLNIQKFAARGVEGVITDSQNSKKDIINYLDFPPEKIFVVYLAPDKIFKPITNHQVLASIKNKYNLPEKFILYVGDVNLHKNLKRLLETISKVNLPLVVIGEAWLKENLAEARQLSGEIVKLGIENKVKRLGFVEGENLVGIYNLATLLVEPSLYEGFGLPVLEAMACGLPVACSNTSSLPEIGGAAPIYFDPNSGNDMVLAIQKVINWKKNQPANYDELKRKGLSQATKFSWEKTAKETIKVYQKVVYG